MHLPWRYREASSCQIDAAWPRLSKRWACGRLWLRTGSKVHRMSQQIVSHSLSCHRPFCRARCASSNNIPSQCPYHRSGRPTSIRRCRCPFFYLSNSSSREAVGFRANGCTCVMRPSTRFGEIALPVKILPGFGNGGGNLLKQDVVPRASLLLLRITLWRIRVSTLYER